MMPVVCNSQILRQSAMVQSLPAFGRQGLLGHAPALVQRRSAALGGRYQVKVEAAKGKFFVGGNWKCNGTISEVTDLVQQLNKGGAPQDVEVVVAPTFLHLDYVKNNLKSPYQVAAQNCWTAPTGAYTGEISAEQLVDFGIPWVILGHSERRALIHETNALIGQKAFHALETGLKVIACVGETLEERESGKIFDVLNAQLSSIADDIVDWTDVVIAYEPVWAIGTGKVASPEQAQEVHEYIRNWFASNVSDEVAENIRIIYGGSVNDKNAATLAGQKDVDGFLVGGASLKGPAFIKICEANLATAA